MSSKKRTPKGAFHGPTGGFFSQKKKAVLGNVKHSSDEKNISLNKSKSGDNVFSNVNSLSGNKEVSNITGINVGSLLSSAVNTSKAKHVNTGTAFGSSLSSPNFDMNDDKEMSLPSHLLISLDKKWVDPKIVKTQVEVLVRQSSALDINFLVVEEKLEATTPSKFEKIIRFTFTSKSSMKKTVLLAKEKEIIINTNFKKQRIHSDQAVVIKKILMNMPKNMIVTALAEFGKIKSIKIQLIGLWQKAVFFLIGKDSVHVIIAVGDCETWTLRNRFRVLLFTLPIRTTAHDLGTLLDGTSEKTCVINCSIDSDNWVYCIVVGFESKEDLESAYCTELIFGGVKLSWTRLNLVYCEKCEHFGHSALECNVSSLLISKPLRPVKRVPLEDYCLWLAKLYTRKGVPISKPVVFGGKSWMQMVSLASSSGPYFDSGFEFGPPSSDFSSIKGSAPIVQNKFLINDCLALLEHSLELLANQVSDIVHRLNGVELVLLVPITQVVLSIASVSTLALPDTDMVLDIPRLSLPSFSSVFEDKIVDLGLSSSKILTSKVGGLESKMMALKEVKFAVHKFGFFVAFFASISELIWRVATCNIKSMLNLAKQKDIVHWHKNSENMILIVIETKLKSDIKSWIMNKFDELRIFTSGLDVGFCGTEVAIIMNNFLPLHVLKVDEISGHLISVHLLFKNKLSVMILNLQAVNINFMVFKTVNSSSFVVLSGNFNENGSSKNVSFKFCLGLGLVNTFDRHFLTKASI
ncbi:hypothetical protein G9A89_021097 [Geosiphon pyriformis]|nr:hypothetical protein G9A89_021097 [Geosiphon pyriformis]